MSGKDDATVLEWAAQEGRVLLTHDVSTMSTHCYDRIRKDQQMPGVFQISRRMSVGAVIDDVLLLAEHSIEGEWEGQVRYLPLQ